MVSQQATQDSATPHPRPTDWQRGDDSVRITARVSPEVRRQIEVEFLTRELARQQEIAAFEVNDLKSVRSFGLPTGAAEHRASNATAVLQYLGSTLRAKSDNRDFRGVTR